MVNNIDGHEASPLNDDMNNRAASRDTAPDVDDVAGVGLDKNTVADGDTMGVAQGEDPMVENEKENLETINGRNGGTATEGGVRGANERDDVTGLNEEELERR